MAKRIDVTVENHGTIFLFNAHTVRAKTWIAENVFDAEPYFGQLAVEHRYARDLADGMQAAGLRLV